MADFPQLLHTVVDAPDVRGLAEFYRQLLGLQYRPGDEAGEESEETPDWLVLTDENGRRLLAFQRVAVLERTTWPEPDVPMQMHLDFTVPDRATLERQHSRALALGAELLIDRTADPDEPLYVYADLAGHPFCIFVR
jgi:catechol 2,3-dioxygenase-like lactoylglutathione lyase family enzyme